MASIPLTTIWDDVIDFLTSAPSPQQIIDFRASETLQERVRYLLDQNREGTLTAEENAELDEIGRMNNIIRRLKIRAMEKLAES